MTPDSDPQQAPRGRAASSGPSSAAPIPSSPGPAALARGRFGEAPIVDLDAFAALRPSLEGTIVATSGGFDPIHPGHASCLLGSKDHVEARTGVRPDLLIVVVNGDGFLRNKKGAAFQDLATRCRIVACLRGVDVVVPYETETDMSVVGALRAIRPHYFTKGGDRTDMTNIAEWPLSEELGFEILAGCGVDKDWSSSDMLARWADLVRQGALK
ncbi:MAG: adenylyltransferase/cytidyltransferase family protein [Planctomycetota bacterium]